MAAVKSGPFSRPGEFTHLPEGPIIRTDIRLTVGAVALVLMVSTSALAQQPGRCVLTNADRRANAALSFEDFDQKGVLPSTWRALSNDGCFDTASDAMESYLLDGPVTDQRERGDMSFHLGQTLALAGRTSEATVAMTAAARTGAAPDDDFDWHTYVVGTWAFLARDRERLEAAKRRLSSEPGRGNQINAAALSGLDACFDRPYVEAYQRPCREKADAPTPYDGVTIVSGDGADGASPGGPFDRIMVTAGVWEPSPHLWQQLVEGGLMLAPVELRGGGGCRVTLFRRTGERLTEERSAPGWFVPLVGQLQRRDDVNRPLDTLASWPVIKDVTPARWPLPLASQSGGGRSAATRFRDFLGRTEPGFTVFAPAGPPSVGLTDIEPFGVVVLSDDSIALWKAGELLAYGGLTAARRMACAYSTWTELGMPDGASFSLEISAVGAAAYDEHERWVEVRGGTALTWCLRPGARDWRTLLRDAGGGHGHGRQDTVRPPGCSA